MAWRNPYKLDKEVPDPNQPLYDFEPVDYGTGWAGLMNGAKYERPRFASYAPGNEVTYQNRGYLASDIQLSNLNGNFEKPSPIEYKKPVNAGYLASDVQIAQFVPTKVSPATNFGVKSGKGKVAPMPPANTNAGIINRYNYYENQKTPLSAQKRVGTMGETYGTTENKLWQKAKIGSMGETYNASTAIQRYNTAYTNFKDWLKSTTVTTGYSAPPTTGAGSGYGGGYYYGGGGGGSYKPTPSPWYMELTNWKI